MAIVEHVAHHLLAGADEAERARGRHAEVVAHVASLHRNSRIDERSTARPSARREYGVGPAPFNTAPSADRDR